MRALKGALESLSTRKSTSRRIPNAERLGKLLGFRKNAHKIVR